MEMAISSSTGKLRKTLHEWKFKWSQISLTIVSSDSFSKNADEVQEQRNILQSHLCFVHILSALCPVW